MDMTILIETIRGYLLGIWQYRWYGLISAWVLAICGWCLVANLPDRYSASTRVFIDTQSLIKPLLRDISISSDADERISQVAKTIFNRPNLQKIAQMSDLDLNVRTAQEEEDLLDRLEREIKLRREGRDNLFKISYEHGDPKQAKVVIQSILNLFLESTLSYTRGDTIEAQKFLDGQIDSYEEELVNAENRLARFKRAHLGVLPQEDKNYYDNLQKLISEIDEQNMKLEVAKKRRDEFKKQIAGETPTFGLSLSNQVQNLNHPLVQKYNELERQSINLQTRYTDNHPDVINIKREMAEIKTNIDIFKSSIIANEANQSLNQNPVFQQMKMSLNESNAEVATLEATVKELMSAANTMRSKVDEVIQSETDLANLNRDYLINKQKFHALLERREAAKLAEEMDDTQQTIKFRVIDPPFVPSMPVGPKRGLYALAVFILSIIFGVGVAFARSQLSPAILNRFKSDPNFPYPTLAEIPKLTFHDGPLNRYAQVALTSGMVGLLVASAVLLAILYHYHIGPKF
tara:strand:+ start:48995 stop:50548 length:1554 start_codon:yes stop_codon:yes gene_type:complete